MPTDPTPSHPSGHRRLLAALLVVTLLLAAFPRSGDAQTTEADLYVAQAILEFDDKHYEQALVNLRRALEIEP
ncbi:MAG: OapA N-terminal domain-containing protein, partial [Candidatus Rokuibacteriota bacterium]